jgi:hypothetical protein
VGNLKQSDCSGRVWSRETGSEEFEVRRVSAGRRVMMISSLFMPVARPSHQPIIYITEHEQIDGCGS